MHSLNLELISNVLCFGAHCDDIEIGCGGMVLALARSNPKIMMTWVILSADDSREREARDSAARFLCGFERPTLEVKRFRNGYFPYQVELKDFFESMKSRVRPDLIFTHCRGDRHQDHRTVNELTWNTFRDHLILEYEIPKWDGDIGQPNLYLPLEDQVLRAKLRNLMTGFPSQHELHWYSEETFSGMMRIRGIECRAPSGYAEAFFAPKLMVSLGSGGEVA